jgi:hypothetical protein
MPSCIKRNPMKIKSEYDRFEGLVRGVLNVPHSEIKAKLDAEKAAKKRKKARTTSASVSRVAADMELRLLNPAKVARDTLFTNPRCVSIAYGIMVLSLEVTHYGTLRCNVSIR